VEADGSGPGGEQASEPEDAYRFPPARSAESSFFAPTSSATDVGTASGHSRRLVVGIVAAVVVVVVVVVVAELSRIIRERRSRRSHVPAPTAWPAILK
jgi:hypothetical protein